MWLEIIIDAWCNLMSRKMRFFLVSFGVAIGSAAFIILLNVGLSVIEQTMRQFAAVGVDIVTFTPERDPETGQEPPLNIVALENAARLSQNIEDLTFITVNSMTIMKDRFRQSASVVAADQSLYSILKLTAAQGRLLMPLDGSAAHAVIGADLARYIAQENGAPLVPGAEIFMGNTGFVVVGILKAQPENVILPFQVSNMILIRPDAMKRFLKADDPKIAVGRLSSVDVFTATDRIIRTSYQKFTGKGSVTVTSAEQLIEAMTQQSKLFATFLIVIGLIVFGVAGIGVMNSLMTSLNERLHEIGVRLAIGAQPEHIVGLFLTEALIICLSGGLAGLTVGTVALYFISSFQEIPVTFDLTIILLGIGAVIMSGIIFGLYPALKAAWVKPISALRME